MCDTSEYSEKHRHVCVISKEMGRKILRSRQVDTVSVMYGIWSSRAKGKLEGRVFEIALHQEFS